MVWLGCAGCIDVVPVARTTKLEANGVPDASTAVPTIPWGEYAATLDVPKCPDGEVLLVDTLDDELEGGPVLASRDQAGALLSFREALTIAANRGGPHSVYFDPEVFPADGTQVVLLRRNLPFPPRLSQICIDGRHRGVTFAWEPSIDTGCEACVWDLHEGSLQVGISLRDVPWALTVWGGHLAGCRVSSVYPINIGSGAKLGPGNVVGPLGSGPGVLVLNSMGLQTIKDNFFGYDPTTGHVLTPLAAGIAGSGAVNMTGNVVLASVNYFDRLGDGSTMPTTPSEQSPKGLLWPQASNCLVVPSEPTYGAQGRLVLATSFEDSESPSPRCPHSFESRATPSAATT